MENEVILGWFQSPKNQEENVKITCMFIFGC